ncbi:cytochrome P450 [Nocardia cyriacigeorgica]|uniref:cytochrome P450 n=1 Tax=Nocardia cyriacigeorgica TaxID=135487 RepID=UPI00245897DB|nr:cytochrome P450 [Nocardia cyriacigeorgica]
MTTLQQTKISSAPPPVVSGKQPLVGHLPEFLLAPERVLWRGQRQHGNIFQLAMPGADVVVLLGKRNSDFFFKETDKRLSISDAYPFFTRMFGPEFYFMGGVEQWKKQREVVLPRFQGAQIADYVRVMDQEAARFVESLGEHGEFDLTEEFGPLVMRIAAHAFLGPAIADDLVAGDFFEEFRKFSMGMGFFLPDWLPLPRTVRSNRARDRLQQSLGDMIGERRRAPLDPPDFLQSLVESRYADGTRVPDDVLINFVLLFCWAGHETTTGHVAWALADLIEHPSELRRVRAEAERLLAADRVDLAGVRGMQFTYDCLHETERLHPVAYILARQAQQELDIDGYTIPRGAFVFTSPAISHRLREAFPEATEAYWPDRYSQPGGKSARGSLIGFGAGAHRCLGTHFAHLEMLIIVARLVAEFELELVHGMPKPVSGAGVTKWPAGPCTVRYRRRR